MMRPIRLVPLVLAMLGCASVSVGDRDEYKGAKLPRPERILVHDFAATPEDLPDWSEEKVQFVDRSAGQSAEELKVGRELGAEVARQLVAEISEMGLPALRAGGQPPPRQGDIILIGAFTSLDEGSAVERVAIGFGKGAANVKAHVAGYRMEDGAYRKLGSGSTNTAGEKTPGAVVPAIVTVATANPIGLVVGGAVKAAGEVTGHSTIEGAAKRTAEKIAEELKLKFEEQGWI